MQLFEVRNLGSQARMSAKSLNKTQLCHVVEV